MITKINEILGRIKYRAKEKKKITKEDTDKQLEILKADLEAGYITEDTYDKQKGKIEKLIKKEEKIEIKDLKKEKKT